MLALGSGLSCTSLGLKELRWGREPERRLSYPNTSPEKVLDTKLASAIYFTDSDGTRDNDAVFLGSWTAVTLLSCF